MGVTRAAQRAASRARLREGAGGLRRAVRAGSGAALHVHIGELVLHGFSPAAGRRIGDGVHSELTRLFATAGVPSAMVSAPAAERVDAGPIRIASRAAAARIGGQIARAIYGVGRK